MYFLTELSLSADDPHGESLYQRGTGQAVSRVRCQRLKATLSRLAVASHGIPCQSAASSPDRKGSSNNLFLARRVPRVTGRGARKGGGCSSVCRPLSVADAAFTAHTPCKGAAGRVSSELGWAEAWFGRSTTWSSTSGTIVSTSRGSQPRSVPAESCTSSKRGYQHFTKASRLSCRQMSRTTQFGCKVSLPRSLLRC